MDPSQSSHMVLESLLDKQWFVAAIIIFFFIFFIAAVVWGVTKFREVMDNSISRQDQRDEKSNIRLDKKDEELKEIAHNYYNAFGTMSLTLQATGQAVTGLAERQGDIETRMESLEKTIQAKLEAK